MSLEYVAAYYSYLDYLAELSDAECGRLFKACLTYGKTGAEPELRGNERFVWPGIKSQIDRDAEKYQKRCEQNRNNRQRPSTNVNDRQRPSTNRTKENAKEKEKEKAKTKAKESIPPKAPQGAKFTPPSLDDVRGYCEERGGKVDPERFFDYYTANGWRVGKNPMKDWRATVRNWERQESGPPTRGRRGNGNVFLEMLEEERGL